MFLSSWLLRYLFPQSHNPLTVYKWLAYGLLKTNVQEVRNFKEVPPGIMSSKVWQLKYKWLLQLLLRSQVMEFYVAVIRQNCVKGRTNWNNIVVYDKEIRHHWDKKNIPNYFLLLQHNCLPLQTILVYFQLFSISFLTHTKNDLLKHSLYCCNISNSKANFSGQNVKPSMFKECLQLGKIQLLQSKTMHALHTHAHTCQRENIIFSKA